LTRLAALVAAAAVIAPAAALAGRSAKAEGHSVTRTSGQVTATVSWRGKYERTRNFRISISRAGTEALDTAIRIRGCSGQVGGYACLWPVPGGQTLVLRDIDSDGEPEAVVAAFTGGAHCCLNAIVYRWTGTGYEGAVHDFRDPGFRLHDYGDDGTVEFRTYDARFAYLYGSYAESVFPLQIVSYSKGQFSDATAQFPDAVARDLSRVRHEYRRRAHSRRHLGVRSALAAYVAELYLVGDDKDANRALHRALRRDLLEDTRYTVGPANRKFIHSLKKQLRRWGYL
jgi:hypothetical protein